MPSSMPVFLTDNFTLEELTFSQTASRKRIDNRPSGEITSSLRILCERVLQPIRNHFDRPVIVTSGYRSPALNKVIGGSLNSQHMKGEAADFHVSGVDNYTLAEWIAKNLDFDQLILEYCTGGQSGWVHCSYVSHHLNRHQKLTINASGTYKGLKHYG